MRSLRRHAPLLAATLAACTGSISDPVGTRGPTSTATDFVCDPSVVPPSLPLPRLSKAQRRNAVNDLVRFALPTDADAVIASVKPLLDATPVDVAAGTDKTYARYTRLDQSVQQEHVDAGYAAAVAVGKALSEPASRLTEVAGACATDADASNDAACLSDFITRFGERALRRPMSPDDLAFYAQPAGAPPFDSADYADVIALVMSAPESFYFVESGDPASSGERVPLDAYELASRLSFHFWQTAPDGPLLEAAKSGALLTKEGYEAEVDRLLADPRAREAAREFFSEWLENATLQELDSRKGDPVFDAFVAGYDPGPDLREHMLAEVVDAALYYTFDAPSSYDAFFTSNASFARTDDLASIYGVPTWDGLSAPPSVAQPERAGLLTRAAFLSTGSATTRPIMKGVFIRKAILCDDIAPPPPNAAAVVPELSPSQTTRQVVEGLTGTGACAACHPPLINPLGFATENFDAIGRVRKEQTFFDPMTGAVVGSAPVDTSGTPAIDDGDAATASDAHDLVGLIVESPKFHACFARQYFRFTFRRVEDLGTDGCALAGAKSELDRGGKLADVLRSVALSDAFKTRSFLGEGEN
ncbi:MAG: DUF1592 domain-containing protein [Polyangiaceae bacterium]